jgi:uncharacterized protein
MTQILRSPRPRTTSGFDLTRMKTLILAALALAMMLGGLGAAPAAAQPAADPGSHGRAAAAASADRAASPDFVLPNRNRINGGTVTILTAPVGGALAAMGSDLARVLDSDTLRVLPILGKGSVQNIIDVLYLKNVDLAFAYSDALEFVKNQYQIPDIYKRVTYVTKVYNSDVHIIASTSIKSVRDLAGKKIMSEKNLGYFSARTIFDRLGITASFDYNTDDAKGLYKLQQGEADAWIVSAGRVAPIVRNFVNEGGRFHLVSIPYDEQLQDIYAPSSFTNADYPNLIAPDETVSTVSSSLLLMAFNWPEGSDRYNRVKRFVDAFFSGIDELQTPARHPKWHETNLSADVPGWIRFRPAQDWLKAHAGSGALPVSSGGEFQRFLAQKGEPARTSFSPMEVERLVRDFQAWKANGGR